MKKRLSVLLALAMLLSLCLPTSAQEQTPNATEAFFRYDVLEDGTARITEYLKTFDEAYTSVCVPSQIDGYTVSTIGNCAFLRAFYAYTVILPDTVTVIEQSAFQESGVKTIFLPSSLQTIEDNAFFWCTNLKKLVIPSSVVNIGKEAFGYTIVPDPDEPNLVPGISGLVPEFTVYADNNHAVTDYAAKNGITLTELSSLPDGDADLNGETNTADVRTILQYCMYSGSGIRYWQAGDFNQDGEMNTVDARECLRDILENNDGAVSPSPGELLVVPYEVDYIEVAQGSVFVGDADFPMTLTSEDEWNAFITSDPSVDANCFYERRDYDEAFFNTNALIVVPIMGDDTVIDFVQVDAETVYISQKTLYDPKCYTLQRSAFALIVVEKTVAQHKAVATQSSVIEQTRLDEEPTNIQTVCRYTDHPHGYYLDSESGVTDAYNYHDTVVMQDTEDIAAFIAAHEVLWLDENGEPITDGNGDPCYLYREFVAEDFAAYDEAFFENNVLIVGFSFDDRLNMNTPTVTYYSINNSEIVVGVEQTVYPNCYELWSFAQTAYLISVPRTEFRDQTVSFYHTLYVDYRK